MGRISLPWRGAHRAAEDGELNAGMDAELAGKCGQPESAGENETAVENKKRKALDLPENRPKVTHAANPKGQSALKFGHPGVF